MEKEIISVWVSQTIERAQVVDLFERNKFISDFKIYNEDDFFDEEHLIILSDELPIGSVLDDLDKIIKGYSGLEDVWQKVKVKLNKLKINKINYLLAAPDFKYSGKIIKSGHLEFIGSFEYKKDMSYVSKWLKK